MTSKAPYITANALIRYCDAKAPERNRIISEFRDNRFPPFKGWYGGETEGAVRRYIASGGADDHPLSSLEAVLEMRPANTEFEETRLLKQLEAIQATRETPLSKIVAAGSVELLQDSVGPFYVEGVRVSVRPTNLISANKVGFKGPHLGAIKPYFSATTALSLESAKLYGSLLHWWVEDQLNDFGQADPMSCFVVDVFQRKVYRAPKAYKQRRDLIAFSCREIFDRWGSAPLAVAALPRA